MTMYDRTAVQKQMAQYRRARSSPSNAFPAFIASVLMIISILIAVPMGIANVHWAWIVAELVILNLVGLYILLAFKIADQWDKAIVLRLGRFVGLKGPGPFWIMWVCKIRIGEKGQPSLPLSTKETIQNLVSLGRFTPERF